MHRLVSVALSAGSSSSSSSNSAGMQRQSSSKGLKSSKTTDPLSPSSSTLNLSNSVASDDEHLPNDQQQQQQPPQASASSEDLPPLPLLPPPVKKKKADKIVAVNLFNDGFLPYLESGLYTDLTLVMNNKEYRVHRIIVAHSSDFFRRLLSSDFKERGETRVELKYEDRCKVFPLLLRYMYEGSIQISELTVVPLLAMADHFLVDRLRKQCLEYVETKITRDNCLSLLKQSIDFQMEEVQDRCLRVASKNFYYLEHCDISFLPIPVMLKLLQHPGLAVKNEFTVYSAACRYIEVQDPKKLAPEDITAIFETVRFPFFTLKQIEKAEANPLVPRHLIIEGLVARLKKVENPHEIIEGKSMRLQPRESYGISFSYHHDFDERGILYYIGTNGYTTPFTNPALDGRVKMTASSIEKGDPVNIADYREPIECWTKDIPASWFQLDLGERKAVVNYYTIRHGGNYKADTLRNWDFQGSLDGKTWISLKRHNSDTSLNDNFATKSWPIHVSDNSVAFRYFRILQKGHNSSDRNYFALSGIEIYGDLYEGNSSYDLIRAGESSSSQQFNQ